MLERLRSLPWPVHHLRGNADRFVVMGYDGTIPERLLDQPLYRADAWTATFLERADRDWLDGLPPTVRFELDGLGEVLFCHATPHSDEERVSIFATDERLAAILGQDAAPLVVAGHTHRQFERSVGGRRWSTPAASAARTSTQPGAYWLRLGPGVDLRRTDYDVDAAVTRVPRRRLPARRLGARAGRRRRGRPPLRGAGDMRYVTYDAGAGPRVGVLDGDAVLDAGFDGDMVAFIAAGAPAAGRARSRAHACWRRCGRARCVTSSRSRAT